MPKSSHAVMAGMSMLLLVLPVHGTRPVAVEALSSGQQLGLVQGSDRSAAELEDPEAATRIASAKAQLSSLEKELGGLRAKLQGSDLSFEERTKTVEAIIKKVCGCETNLGGNGMSNSRVEMILTNVESQVKEAQAQLAAGKNLLAAELVDRLNLLRGKLLSIPFSSSSFADSVVKLKANAPTPTLVDPPDRVRREMRSHFTSLATSRSAAKASMNFGIPLENLVPGADAGVGSIAGVVSSALSLVGSAKASTDWQKQEETMQKHEIIVTDIKQPRGAMNIDLVDLELVDAVKDEVKLIAAQKVAAVRRDKLSQFLRRFGSHVCHKVTLGGTRYTRAILKTSCRQKSSTALAALKAASSKNETEDAIGAAFGGSGGMSDSDFDLADQVEYERAVLGGQPGLPTGLWVQSLAFNENWAVINKHVADCTPIWDFIDRDRETFGEISDTLPLEMFQVWYTGFLSLKKYSQREKASMPTNFLTAHELSNWISTEYEQMKPELEMLKICSGKAWCNGYGDCDEKTGDCKCNSGRVEYEGNCYPRLQQNAWDRFWDCVFRRPPKPDLSMRLGAGPSMDGSNAVDEDPWDDSYVKTWMQHLHGENVSVAQVAHVEKALATIIENSESEEELRRTLENSVKAVQALVEIFGSEEYRSGFMAEAEELATVLQLNESEAHPPTMNLEHISSVAPTPEARLALAERIFAFSQKLRQPGFVEQFIDLQTRCIERRQAVLRKLKEGGSRHAIARALRDRAQQLLADAAAEDGTVVPQEDATVDSAAKTTLIDEVLPLQNQASEELVAHFEAMKNGSAGGGGAADKGGAASRRLAGAS